MEIRCKQGYENVEVRSYNRVFENCMEIRFKQVYERTAKVVNINGVREKCGK